MPLALAASGWGMFIRARRQLLLSLRERALRAEADQELHEEQARVAERTRIAREMHDVLAHRISLLALHAGGLEVRPDLPPEQVRETAALLRSTARQALEELRSVIGVLREDAGQRAGAGGTAADARGHPSPRRGDPPGRHGHRLRDARRAGRRGAGAAGTRRLPHRAGGAHQRRQARPRHGGPGPGHRRARAPGCTSASATASPSARPAGPALPGSGAGLLGLQERVALAGGTLVHGPDGPGDFVVEAELTWRP